MLMLLLVQHGHAAFPVLRRVPRADRIIFRLIGFATTDANEQATKQKEQEPSHSAAFHVRRPDARG